MDAVLIILLLMGVCSTTLALYILADAKRGQSGPRGDPERRVAVADSGSHRYLERSKRDRRSGQPVSFPLQINGMIIHSDRRKLADRRRAVAA